MKDRVSVNEKEAWGLLNYDDNKFDACVGVRLADNPKRDFGIFSDRITAVGEKSVVKTLKTWLFSKKTLSAIKRNTLFRYEGKSSRWTANYDIGRGRRINVLLNAECRGEYCYVSAYATRYPSGKVHVEPAVDSVGLSCWIAVMDDRPEFQSPYIYTDTRFKATNIFLDWIANHLEVAGALFEI